MKSIDRACIYICVCLGILIICALVATKEAGIIAICAIVALAIILIYEEKISYYEERAERYRMMFLHQNQSFLDAVRDDSRHTKSKAENIEVNLGRKSGIDKAKVS